MDYLGKCYSRENANQKERFNTTTRDLCGLSEKHTEALYQLRCCLVHEVSISSVSEKNGFFRKYPKGTRFNFKLQNEQPGGLVTLTQSNSNGMVLDFEINLLTLKSCWIDMIAELKRIYYNMKDPRNPLISKNIHKLAQEKILHS
jgi:hypothetical protein